MIKEKKMKGCWVFSLGFTVFFSGCTTVYYQQGCHLQATDVSKIAIGVDTCTTIMERFGPPTTVSLFAKQKGIDRWYYTHRLVAEAPVRGYSTEKHVTLMIVFDAKGIVREKKFIEGENKIKPTKKTTKEYGYKTSLLKETFGNIGKLGQGSRPDKTG
jgi:outer membrane protein assembly factor BamE (lipoprotein component of BamABCDE complex)